MGVDSAATVAIRPELGIPGVAVMSTTRQGGVSSGVYDGFNLGDHVGDAAEHVSQNRALLQACLPHRCTVPWLSQVHGTRVIHAPSEYHPGLEADAVWSDSADYACAIMTADCLPIILADEQGHCIAAVHGGWRGLAAELLRKTIAALPVAPAALVAWLGPSIGPSAFEVGGDVLAAFYLAENDSAVHAIPGLDNKYFLDLTALASRQLCDLGVRAENIYGGDLCTHADPQRFYSFRRDGVTGRMATLVFFDERHG